jgi:hypothetical protein
MLDYVTKMFEERLDAMEQPLQVIPIDSFERQKDKLKCDSIYTLMYMHYIVSITELKSTAAGLGALYAMFLGYTPMVGLLLLKEDSKLADALEDFYGETVDIVKGMMTCVVDSIPRNINNLEVARMYLSRWYLIGECFRMCKQTPEEAVNESLCEMGIKVDLTK